MDTNTPDGCANTIRQTIVETVEAPRLMGITTKDFVKFKQAREVYERRVTEKNQDPNVDMPLTTYRDSITKAILNVFVIGDWIPVDKVDDITEQHLIDCVNKNAVIKPDDYDLARIEEDLASVKLDKADSTSTLEAQVWNLVHKYLDTLEKCGYNEFTEKHSKLAVEHVLKRVSHPFLKNRMLITARLKSDEEFKENFVAFVRELAKEAQFMDRMNAAKRYKPTSSEVSDGFAKRVTEKPSSVPPPRRQFSSRANDKDEGNSDTKKRFDRTKNNSSATGAGKRHRDLPKCLNTKCPKRHFIVDCEDTPEEEKKVLKAQYRENKRAKKAADEGRNRHKGTVGAIEGAYHTDNTSLFSASFCGGAVEATVLADQGADANLIPPSVLDKVLKANPSIEVQTLKTPLVFSNARSSAPRIECERQIELDVLLRVRHGTNLMLRGMKWLVTKDEVQHVFIARHVLSAMGLNNRVLLAAASDRYNGVVDVPNALKKDGQSDVPCASSIPESSIHSILQHRSHDCGSTFHSAGGCEEDFLEDSNIYVDLGDDPKEDLDTALAALVKDAVANGISEKGAARLTSMLETYPVFRLRLGKSPPADVEPMRIRLEPDCRPVKVKARRYSADQRAFLNKYVKKLKEMDFFEEMPSAAWQAAPLLVPKQGNAK